MEIKPLQALLLPIKEPEELPMDATNLELYQRALEGRLGIREANARFKALSIQFGVTQ